MLRTKKKNKIKTHTYTCIAKYKSDCITPLVKILWWLSTALGMISKVYPLPYKFLALGTIAPDDLDGMIWLLIFFPFIRLLSCASHTSLLFVLNPFPLQALYTVPLPVNSPSPAWLAWFIFVVQDSAQTTQPHSTSPWLLLSQLLFQHDYFLQGTSHTV